MIRYQRNPLSISDEKVDFNELVSVDTPLFKLSKEQTLVIKFTLLKADQKC